jgi:integrating conjugative element membrane protein (TIGR03747 family)
MPADRNHIEHGMLVRQWKWPLRVVFWWVMIASCVWVYAIAAHWLWAWRAAPQAPLAHSRAVLEGDLAALAPLRPRLFEPMQVSGWIASTLQDGVLDVCLGAARALMNWPTRYRDARIRQAGDGGAASPTSSEFDAGAQFVADQLAAGSEALGLLATGTQIFAVRTALYLASLPLLTLLAGVAVADGFVARARRKACAGRESASLYHRAKLAVSFVAILGYVACVGVPSMVEPSRLLLPIVLLVTLAVRLQADYYKKYL